MEFEVVGPIQGVEAIAEGARVRVGAYLRKIYGPGRWRKMKGTATVRLLNGFLRTRRATLVRGARNRRDLKIKRYLDEP
jgi:hypothetical protein